MTDNENIHLEFGGSSEIGMVIILALMMFSVALGLRKHHFLFFKEQPSVYLSGVIAQIIALPLLTLALCFIVQPHPSVALGMILISCCPGGNVSNLLVVLARGNAALSVSLTATSSLAAAFVTPFAILFWSSLYPPTDNLLTEIHLDKLAFLKQTSLILVLPMLFALFLLKFYKSIAEKIRNPLLVLSSLGLLVIIVVSVAKSFGLFKVLGMGLFALIILHNALAFALGYIAAKLCGADQQAGRALTYEVGIQNAGLGLVILLTQLANLGSAAIVIGVWGVWHIIAGIVLVLFFRRLDRVRGIE